MGAVGKANSTASETTPAPEANAAHAPSRVMIEALAPAVEGGAFPIKRTVGEPVVVTASVYAEGHDILRAVLKRRRRGTPAWLESAMEPLGNDVWRGSFSVDHLGLWEYTVQGWVDRFASWRKELRAKAEAGQDVASELLEGADHVRQAAQRAGGDDNRAWLTSRAQALASSAPQHERVGLALDEPLAQLMEALADRSTGFEHPTPIPILVERERARYSSWYEMFPRSAASQPGRHGTLRDVEARLPYVAGMGFDVLYLPPIHPIGRAFRKGPNNTLTPGPNDPGSPWAIGAPEGGHTAVHPELGTLDDFDRLVASAARVGIELALDIAFQCSPDHPWVKQHPEWFRHRPDGTIKYAENPPKKYQDIYPLDFESPAWESLYAACRDVFLFWADHGVRIFRVDNPHTKPFRFWDWVIPAVREKYPDAIFLSEAFTRPKLMKRLAKSGYSQSYSYFTWRNTKYEIEQYFNELYRTDVVEYMRPNLFPVTPDILNEYLHTSGPPGFKIRATLAATLGANYGIYGPPFEHCIGTPVRPGSEEYLDSEKYQVRHWDLNRPGSLRDYLARLNQVRRDNPALQYDRGLRFVPIDNPQMIAFVKTTDAVSPANQVFVVINLDPYHTQSGWIDLPTGELGLAGSWGEEAFQVHDLISDARYMWSGARNFIQLDPGICPAHVFRIRRKLHTEQDFDYFA
jgi:starch synthase (maltosyl-transferring)